MKRFGNDLVNTETKMDSHHLSFMRLHLLIIMIKARLDGYPVGIFRKRAVLENATELHRQTADISFKIPGSRSLNHLFKERVKLLCVMATAMISDDYPLGVHRRAAILENIDSIVDTAFPHKELQIYHDLFKAA
ncbi:MAG: hypothetical protein MI802_02350 [Desulfobacterales bacterium]|nr:hypothetical protein [Desulfobacterales bacterium]